MSHACHRFWICHKPARFAHFWQGPQSLAPATRNDIWTSKSGPTPLCFWHFDFQMCFAPQRRALFRHLNCQKWSRPGVFCTFWLGNVLRATTACTFSHFFDIATSKSGPNMVCFVHFDIEMCFAPQQRALLRDLNFQKLSEHGLFCTFWLGNVLRATTACTFSSLIWPDGSAPAALASLPNFRHPRSHKSLEKHRASRLSYLFAHLHLLLTLSLLSSSLFCSSLLPASSHLCFSSVYIVGSLTAKLPSVIIYQWIILNRLSMGYLLVYHDFLWVI